MNELLLSIFLYWIFSTKDMIYHILVIVYFFHDNSLNTWQVLHGNITISFFECTYNSKQHSLIQTILIIHICYLNDIYPSILIHYSQCVYNKDFNLDNYSVFYLQVLVDRFLFPPIAASLGGLKEHYFLYVNKRKATSPGRFLQFRSFGCPKTTSAVWLWIGVVSRVDCGVGRFTLCCGGGFVAKHLKH